MRGDVTVTMGMRAVLRRVRRSPDRGCYTVRWLGNGVEVAAVRDLIIGLPILPLLMNLDQARWISYGMSGATGGRRAGRGRVMETTTAAA